MLGQGRRRCTSFTFRTLLLGALLLAAVAPAAQASISIGDVSVFEADGDGAVASFTVTRTGGLLTGNATIAFATADGTARAPADYAATSGSLFFGSLPLGGEQAQQVHVAVRGDALDEPSETFRVLLSGSSEIVDGEGVATIVDDDPPPVVAVSDAPATAEGATAAFTISLSAPSGHDVSVAFTTADGSAVSGQDYTARSGTIAIAAGATSASIGVPTLDDGADEPDEAFELRLASPVSATPGRARAAATIVDNDEPPAPPSPAEPSGPAGAGGPAGTPGVDVAAPPGTTSSPAPQLGLSRPRLRRPSIVLVTVFCPREATRCRGRVAVFSRPNRRSKIRALRRERRLGQRNFTLLPGRTRTLTMALSKADRVLLKRTGRMLVRAYAVTRDASGRSAVHRTTGTLVARTTHS
ncbi:MAG: hypothetical protein KY463_10190 [Actinobacteria bacterium]|nr:hypothetical protein [Actinomycetota bacterium]